MSQAGPPAAALRKVPVGETVMEAYGTVLGRLGPVAKAAAVPFLLSILLAAVSLHVRQGAALAMLLLVAGFVPYTLFGVAWHRATLLGPGAGGPPAIPSWRRRHTRFLGYMIAVMLIVYAVSFPFLLLGALVSGTAGPAGLSPSGTLAATVAGAALIVVLPYVVMRLSFIFPAVAVDEAYRLSHSWTHTRGQGFRLLAVVLLLALPMLGLIWAVSSLLGVYVLPDFGQEAGTDGQPDAAAIEDYLAANAGSLIAAQGVMAAINYVLMALIVSAVSISFRACTGWVPALGGPPAPAERDGDRPER